MENLRKVFNKKRKQYKTLSPLETRIVDELLRYEELKFESNFKVGVYFVDIAFPNYRVGLEIDGHAYHTSEDQVTKDRMRQEYLQDVMHWKIERVPGWFCYRYPEITVAKVLRHIPEVKDNPLFIDGCHRAKQWLARDLLNEGNINEAIEILKGEN